MRRDRNQYQVIVADPPSFSRVYVDTESTTKTKKFKVTSPKPVQIGYDKNEADLPTTQLPHKGKATSKAVKSDLPIPKPTQGYNDLSASTKDNQDKKNKSNTGSGEQNRINSSAGKKLKLKSEEDPTEAAVKEAIKKKPPVPASENETKRG